MSMNPYVGWGVSTLLLWFLNRNSSSDSDQSETDPEALNFSETSIGTPVPIVIGKAMIKDPLVTYWGDFRADRYTETYSAHAEFSAWPLVFSLIAQVLTAPATGTTNPGQPVKVSTPQGPGTGATSGPGTNKDTMVTPLIQALFMWLLMWLINGRNLKTTIQKGFKYYLGYQEVFARSSPGMRLRAVYIEENKVWEGNVAREDVLPGPLVIKVNDENLFGGVDEGGGFVGELHVYLGGDNQNPDAWMQSQMNQSSVQEAVRGLTPAYRSCVSVVVPTAYIGKNAKIPKMWLELEYIPNGLGLGAIGEDANPAEILHVLHTNSRWGMGQKESLLDIDKLKVFGQKLAEEKIGLTVTITSIKTARSIVDLIMDHVNGVRYIEPSTGKMVHKLIRNDYDVNAIPVANEKNVLSQVFTRLDWQESVGEVSITYTDRKALYESSTIGDNDPAVIEIAGSKTVKSYSYPFFTTSENALWAAKRECRQQGYPLGSFSGTLNRTLYNLRIGDVFVYNMAPYGVKNMVLRVTDSDYGDLSSGDIKIEAMEDIFSLEKTEFGFSGSTGWNPEAVSPTGVQRYRFFEMPWELFPEKNSYVFGAAAKPDQFTEKWTVWRNYSTYGWQTTSSMTKWTPSGTLVYSYGENTDAIDNIGFTIVELCGLKELRSSSLSTGVPDIESARKGGKYLMVDDEIMAWSKIEQLANGHWAVSGIIRGVMDTVPATHADGSPVFFLESSKIANVTTGGFVCPQGSTTQESYDITTATADKEEELDYTKAVTLTTQRRSERENPPGRIRMTDRNNTKQKFISTVFGDLTVEWTPRNKERAFGVVSQDDVKDYWTGEDIVAPDGMDFVARVMSGATVLHEYSVASSPFVLTWAERASLGGSLIDRTKIEIYSRKDSLLSLYPQEREFSWFIPVLVDVCLDADAVAARMTQWGKTDRILIPAGTLNINEFQTYFNEFPIFLLGNAGTPVQSGSIACYDGTYIIPDGRAVIVKPDGTTEEVMLPDGFLFSSHYVPEASGGLNYYRFNGGTIEQVTEV